MIDVIYLAGGIGDRVGLPYPKQLATLGGKPLLLHGLEIYQSIKEVQQIIVVYPMQKSPDWSVELTIMEKGSMEKVVFVEGGETRQESVKKGLEMVTTDFVLIGESVRPFINEYFVRQILRIGHDFVVPLKTAVSSVLTFDGLSSSIPRHLIGEVQMPQKYLTELLRKAHARTNKKDTTDDSVLVLEETGEHPVLIRGLEENIKITTPLDLVIAEAIYDYRRKRKWIH